MAGRPRTVKPVSRKPVKKLNSNIELLALSPVARKILGCLGAEGVASEAANVAGCTKANVSYWTKRFLGAGVLRLQTGGFVKYYSLTPYGSKLLTGSEGGFRFPVVLEDHAVKFRVLRRECVALDWRKLGSPRNWVKLGVRVGAARVVLNQGVVPSVVIHPGQLKGFDVDELEVDAGRVVEMVRGVLEGKFGMRLSVEGVPLHKPVWQVYRPECRAWFEAGSVDVKGVGRLDHSPPSRVPHLEYDRKGLAVSAVNFPLVLESVEAKVDFLVGEVARLVGVVDRFVDVLGSVFGLEGSGEDAAKLGGSDYVR